MRDAHEQALRAAAAEYRRARDTYRQAREALTAAIKAAYRDGMKQAEILRAIDHVWEREWVRTVLGLARRRRGNRDE